jgi:maleylacetoacetate isomerase
VTIQPVNLLLAEHKKDTFVGKVSAAPLLPALSIEEEGKDTIFISQSIAILRYLNAVSGTEGGRKRRKVAEPAAKEAPAVELWPEDPLDSARVDEIVNVIACDIQPVQNLRVGKKVAQMVVDAAGGTGETKPIFAAWGHDVIDQGFEVLERLLKASAGKYCVGDRITAADLCLVPQVYNARRFKVDMDKYPTIVRVDAALSALPTFAAAHPDTQPDAVPQ